MKGWTFEIAKSCKNVFSDQECTHPLKITEIKIGDIVWVSHLFGVYKLKVEEALPSGSFWAEDGNSGGHINFGEDEEEKYAQLQMMYNLKAIKRVTEETI